MRVSVTLDASGIGEPLQPDPSAGPAMMISFMLLQGGAKERIAATLCK
ncbi:MAG: hypothetical protein ACR2HO_07250 [Rubrobacteraceae bacterium]